MKPVIVILAAGMGSRYGGLKQVEGVGPDGETLLEYSVYDALKAGFSEIIFIIRKDIENIFREKIISRFPSSLPFRFAYQEMNDVPEGIDVCLDRQKPWGTGHAVRAARSVVVSPFAVINADDYYGPGAFELLFRCLSNHSSSDKEEYYLGGYRLENTLSQHGSVSRGLCQVDESGLLTRIEELTRIHDSPQGPFAEIGESSKRNLNYSDIVSMNCWGFRPSIFNLIEESFITFLKESSDRAKSEFYLPQAVADAINSGFARVKVEKTNEQWMGITYPEDRDTVETQLKLRVASGDYPAPLWSH